jgi:hypothetical protein
VAIIEKE